ncbi:MAG: threonine synthase [Acidobacteriota bacterium]
MGKNKTIPPSTLVDLKCSRCGRSTSAGERATVCEACGRPLLARYDLERARRSLRPEIMAGRPSNLWRYREVLPAAGEPVSLGEGWTPLIHAPRLARRFGLRDVLIKDESVNPTGSFKARGLSAAVTMAKERGVARLVIPTAGNAGLALSAYAAAAELKADVFCPADTPQAFRQSMALLGASVHLVDGLIHDCGVEIKRQAPEGGWFDLSTLKEPYRLEGKKTMGYELFEQMEGRLPDLIVYPTGGGTGLVGMWKAFSEMESLGWLGSDRPRMVSVQAAGCAPMVRAFKAGEKTARPWEDARTLASGLRVPVARGDALILQALRESGGAAVAVTDREMLQAAAELGAGAGVLASPEGGATLAAVTRLKEEGGLDRGETVVLFNTGTALSYLESMKS